MLVVVTCYSNIDEFKQENQKYNNTLVKMDVLIRLIYRMKKIPSGFIFYVFLCYCFMFKEWM